MYHKRLDDWSVVIICERYAKCSAEERMLSGCPSIVCDLVFHTFKDKCRMLMKGFVLLRASLNVPGTRLSLQRDLWP